MPREASYTAGLHRDARPESAPAETRAFATPGEPAESLRILVVDGDASAVRVCASALQSEGYLVTACERGEDALALIESGAFDILLLADTPQHSRLDLLRAGLRARPGTLVITLVQTPEPGTNLHVLEEGAWDCLSKPVSVMDLRLRVGRAADAARVSRAAARVHADGGGDDADAVPDLLSRSPVFARVLEFARRVAPTDASVFITGEAGTGKDLLARYIHRHSRRSGQTLATLSCAGLPDALLEGELFGYVPGAFPGAARDRPGLLETARGGTLYLDEISELPLALQARLLKAIHDGSRTDPEGGNPLDLRFIAATSVDPLRAVAEGTLRSDLFYVLAVLPLRVPPLRERPEDIPLLAQYFLVRYWSRHRGRHEPMPRFGAAALRALQDRSWPGNVRELRSAVEHAVVLVAAASEIAPEDLSAPAGTGAQQTAPLPSLATDGEDQSYHTTRDRLLADFETRYLSWLLARTAGNMSRAARIAGVDRTTLYRLMEKHGLHRQTVVLDREG